MEAQIRKCISDITIHQRQERKGLPVSGLSVVFIDLDKGLWRLWWRWGCMCVVCRDGRLKENDQILAINDRVLSSGSVSHQEAIQVLQSATGLVRLLVARSLTSSLPQTSHDDEPPTDPRDQLSVQQQPSATDQPAADMVVSVHACNSLYFAAQFAVKFCSSPQGNFLNSQRFVFFSGNSRTCWIIWSMYLPVQSPIQVLTQPGVQ